MNFRAWWRDGGGDGGSCAGAGGGVGAGVVFRGAGVQGYKDRQRVSFYLFYWGLIMV